MKLSSRRCSTASFSLEETSLLKYHYHMKILFISHTYPPITGGIETQNYELSVWLRKQTNLKLIANRKRWLLPFFLIYAPLVALFSAKKYDLVLLGSCLLGHVGWIVKKFAKKPAVAIAHGLDLTWKNPLYQKLWIGIFIPAHDKLIAVGNETIRQGVARGIPENKFVFIPNGVDTEKNLGGYSRNDLKKLLGINLENKKLLLTSGRLVKRKGVAWFIENVLPKLPENILYIVAGEGIDKPNILKAIEKTDAQKKVLVLGYVTDEQRNILFNTCDVFVQPNIKVENDMEGFGISVIEAAACRMPVIASRLEGLQDAIKDSQNGFLIEPYDISGYTAKINEFLSDDGKRKTFGGQARRYVIENYAWEIISKKYIEEMKKVLDKK